MEPDNVDSFEEIEEEVNEKVEKKVKSFKKPTVKVVKNVIELKSDKNTFSLEGAEHRCKVRYNAKLIEDNSKEAIFESDTAVIKIKKV